MLPPQSLFAAMNGKATLTFRVATFDNDNKSLDVHGGEDRGICGGVLCLLLPFARCCGDVFRAMPQAMFWAMLFAMLWAMATMVSVA